MQTIQYRRWCPPASPVQIEFPAELLHEVRLEAPRPPKPGRFGRRNRGEDHFHGLLFGRKEQQEVRVLAPHSVDGTEVVGIFACRPRGEVFLTDADLERLEQARADIALVVAGGRAGFFVREADGSIQAVRSHEEFAVAQAAAMPAPDEELLKPMPPPKRLVRRVTTASLLLALPVAGFAFFQPMIPRPPIALWVHEKAGQVVLGWKAKDVPAGARLEITDGGDRNVIQIAAEESSLTYVPHSGKVEFSLTTDNRSGTALWDAPPYANHAAPPRKASALETEAKNLRATIEQGNNRVRKLNRQIDALTKP